MIRPLGILAAVMMALTTGCAPSRDNEYERPYIGTWYAQGQDPSLTWRLSKDGGFGEDNGFVTPATDDGEWRVDRGQLIVRKDGAPQKTAKVTVIGDTLTVEEDGKTTIFTRIAK
jgi:hypothetical protein